MFDITTVFIIVILIAIGMLALLSFNPGTPLTEKTPVDMGLLVMRLDLELAGIENQLRTRQLHHEAEGARQSRAKAREFLEAYRA